MDKSAVNKKEVSNSLLEYCNNIVFVRIKEGAEITVESMHEQFNAQKELVENKEYVVLVDGTKHSTVSPEARKLMADHRPPNRKATAIVNNDNLAMHLIANFYLRVNKPSIPTKIFKRENEAVAWLKQYV